MCSDGSGADELTHLPVDPPVSSSSFSTQPHNLCCVTERCCFLFLCVIYMLTGGSLFAPGRKYCSDIFTQAHTNRFYRDSWKPHLKSPGKLQKRFLECIITFASCCRQPKALSSGAEVLTLQCYDTMNGHFFNMLHQNHRRQSKRPQQKQTTLLIIRGLVHA